MVVEPASLLPASRRAVGLDGHSAAAPAAAARARKYSSSALCCWIIAEPTVSKHLRVLREAGFVESMVDAQRRLYRLKPEPLQEVDDWLAPFRRFWSAHVDALERHLERMDQTKPTKRKTKNKSSRPKPRR